jgi:hypothetical protein
LTGDGVVTFVSFQLFDFTNNYGAFSARVFGDTTDWLLQRSTHDFYSCANVRIIRFMVIKHPGCA